MRLIDIDSGEAERARAVRSALAWTLIAFVVLAAIALAAGELVLAWGIHGLAVG